MEPTLYTDNVLIADCISPRLNRIEAGDIIIARLPSNPKTLICKRIVGMPGDRLLYSKPHSMWDSRGNYSNNPSLHKTVNVTHLLGETGDRARSKEIAEHCKNKLGMKEVIVPLGHVWIEGDNRENSGDSRYYGSIPQGLIMSRVVARIWPLTEMKMLGIGSNSESE